MNSPHLIPEQQLSPTDAKEWPDYQLADAREKALRSIYKAPGSRDLLADLVNDTSSYKDGCEFWNTVCSMICAETDSEIKTAQKTLFDWAMNQSDATVHKLACIQLAEDAAYDYAED